MGPSAAWFYDGQLSRPPKLELELLLLVNSYRLYGGCSCSGLWCYVKLSATTDVDVGLDEEC